MFCRYNYSRDDEEIYKEFLEIANDLIPYVIKVVSSGHSARSILKDPECFAYLLRFYDGICQWEEGSATPVLHIGWAKSLVNTISKFDSDIRAQVIIICEDVEPNTTASSEDIKCNDIETNNGRYVNNNNNYCTAKDDGDEFIKVLESKVTAKTSQKINLHPSIEALTAACGEKILNPEYLLQGGGEPFVGTSVEKDTDSTSSSPSHAGTSKEIVDIKSGVIEKTNKKCENNIVIEKEEEVDKKPTVRLYSQKMKGLKDLLLAEKLNTQAISLQLTAQSQVQVGKKGRGDLDTVNVRPKRTRRE